MWTKVQLAGGLDRLRHGRFLEDSKAARQSLPVLRQGLDELTACRARVDELALAERAGARLTTVLDDDYPYLGLDVIGACSLTVIDGDKEAPPQLGSASA